MLSSIFSIIITFLLLSTLVALFNPKKFQFLKDIYDKKNSAITRIDVFLISTVLLTPLIIIAGIVGPNPNHSDINHTIPAVEYSIISNEKMDVGVGGLGDISRITVELPKRISKQQLEKIAYTIKDDSPTERNLIFYVIKGETHIGAWATTHFDTPSTNDENGNVIYSKKGILEKVSLFGLDIDSYTLLLNTKRIAEKDQVGEWIDPNGGFGGEKIRSIYKKKNQFFERQYMFDTSVNKGVEISARLLKINNGKYKYADSDENLYFWVNQAGNLEYSVGSGETYIAKKSTN